ncbi:alpha/beta hydrolase [Streptomyces sp. NBC_00988]|uniref:alpha/beta fold hydrolase n=1 Tax=Streptomyces sp. NBC_00988 TaxID=2903704 RepID=UPI00386FDC29|nr:alpha/beta hydrolase [Streptomyces sp. NBC_00988]
MTGSDNGDAAAAFRPESTAQVFDLASRWVTTGGQRIHYHEAGSGTPVVLLHGSAVGASAAANWWRTIPALADHARVLAPDLAGYGWTEAPDSGHYGLGAWSEQVGRFMDAVGVESAVLIGNSLGGRIGLQVALDQPDRVLGLVTMGSPGLNHRRTEVVGRHVAPTVTREGIARVMADLAADGYRIPDGLVEFRYRMASRPGAPERWAEVVKARDESVAQAGLTDEQVASVTVPALILHGMQDKVVTVADSLDTARALPNGDLMVFAHCGHWVQLEREDDFLAAVTRFLRRVAAPAVSHA